MVTITPTLMDELRKAMKKDKIDFRKRIKIFYYLSYLMVFSISFIVTYFFFRLYDDFTLITYFVFISNLFILCYWMKLVYVFRSKVIKNRIEENNEIIEELKCEGDSYE